MADQVDVRVTFEMVHPDHGMYRDALYYPIDEYGSLTQDDLATAKQERFDNWVTAVSTPTPKPDPVEPQTALEAAQAQLADVGTQVTALTNLVQDAISAAAQAVTDSRSSQAGKAE